MDQTQLNTYFGTIWRRKHLDISQFKFTGLALADQVDDSEQVIDIGCGSNPFKGLIKNLVGIDPAFPEADYQMSLEDYSKHSEQKFDVAFCLGSINFGERDNIKRQIGLVSDLLKENARVYWRCNPGLQDHANADCKYINFFPWSFVEHEQLSREFGFSLADLEWDTHDRIYALWIR